MDNFTITHKGLFFGFLPVYLDMRDENEPGIMARHWSFDPIMDGLGLLVAGVDFVCTRLFGVEVGVPVRITATVGGDGAP